MAGSHTVLHAGLSQSGQIKDATAASSALENFVVKLNESGYISEVFLPIEQNSITVVASREGVTTNQYLKIGEVYTSQTGLRVPRNYTIVTLATENSTSSTYTIEARINGNLVAAESVAVVAATGAHATGLSTLLSAGDTLEVYCSGTAEDPLVWVGLEYTP